MKHQEIYIVGYEDDGPAGICPQVVSITSPWKRLYIFVDYGKVRTFVQFVETDTGRHNSRITGVWQQTLTDDGQLFDPGRGDIFFHGCRLVLDDNMKAIRDQEQE